LSNINCFYIGVWFAACVGLGWEVTSKYKKDLIIPTLFLISSLDKVCLIIIVI